ncbi:MAG TPA: hypothetical protein VJY62_20940 [Bacteroidia bacterium]|nr:hypothetical protein [Bacteroidia bacterium]
MSEKQSSRRKFLQVLGVTAGASLVNTNALAGFVEHQQLLKLNPAQQEFMVRYGKWMDEFIEAIRIKKLYPGNVENQKKMFFLSAEAEKFKPELTEFMKDETFSMIYKASIERVTKEI